MTAPAPYDLVQARELCANHDGVRSAMHLVNGIPLCHECRETLRLDPQDRQHRML